MSNKKKAWFTAAIIVCMFAVALTAALLLSNKGLKKTITFKVLSGSFNTEYEVTTKYKYLSDCLLANGYISYAENEDGIEYVRSVNAISAKAEKGEYWCFYLNDEPLEKGIDKTRIHNGDVFKAKMLTGQVDK